MTRWPLEKDRVEMYGETMAAINEQFQHFPIGKTSFPFFDNPHPLFGFITIEKVSDRVGFGEMAGNSISFGYSRNKGGEVATFEVDSTTQGHYHIFCSGMFKDFKNGLIVEVPERRALKKIHLPLVFVIRNSVIETFKVATSLLQI